MTDVDGGNLDLYAGAERYRRVLDENVVVAGPMTDIDGGNFNLYAGAERCLHLRWDLLHAEFV